MRAVNTKFLVAILTALTALGALLAREVHTVHQTAAATTRLAAERERAAQIAAKDRAAVEKIRQSNKQKDAAAPKHSNTWKTHLP